VGVAVLAGVVALAVAAWRLPAEIRGMDRLPAGGRLRQWWRSRGRGRGGSRLVTGNPVVWRESVCGYGGAWSTWGIFGLVAAVAIGGGLLVAGGDPGFLVALGPVCLLVTGLLWLWRCGAAFTREKRERTIDVLLTTDCSYAEIVEGKRRAIMLSLRPWVACTVVGFAFLACRIVVSSRTDSNWLTLEVAILAMQAYCLCALYGLGNLALYLSARYRSAIAFPVCIGGYVAVQMASVVLTLLMAGVIAWGLQIVLFLVMGNRIMGQMRTHLGPILLDEYLVYKEDED